MKTYVRRLGLVLALVVPACGGGGGGGGSAPALQPDFLLQDVNSNSATNGQNVSPRDYLGLVSAYYFGHAT